MHKVFKNKAQRCSTPLKSLTPRTIEHGIARKRDELSAHYKQERCLLQGMEVWFSIKISFCWALVTVWAVATSKSRFLYVHDITHVVFFFSVICIWSILLRVTIFAALFVFFLNFFNFSWLLWFFSLLLFWLIRNKRQNLCLVRVLWKIKR